MCINITDPLPSPVVLGSNSKVPPVSKPSTSASNKVVTTPMLQNASVLCTTQVSTKESSSQHKTSMHHKCKPKLRGKHHRPTPSDPVSKKEPVESPKSSKPHFITVTHGLRKNKKHRRFHCKECSHVTNSQASPNKHYKESHPPIKCSQCDILFNNPSSLHHHKYQHMEKKCHCQNCDKVFPFESNLASHRLKHHQHLGFQCNHEKNGSICGKWYFAKSDLAKHA